MESILQEAGAESLDELFAKDPLNLTDQNIETIVAALRKQRRLWKEGEAAKAKTKGSPKKAPPKAGFTLDDLDIKL